MPTFKEFLAWPIGPGGALRASQGQRVNVYVPNTTTVPAGLTQGGQAVQWVTSDPSGVVEFTTTTDSIVDIASSDGSFSRQVQSEEQQGQVGPQGPAGPPGAAVAIAASASTVLADRALGTDGTTVALGDGATAFSALPDARKLLTIPELNAKGDARWQRNLGIINVKDHGAAGNGTTDDTTAIQAALTAAAATGRHVFLPAGIYRITTTLTVPSGVTVRGAGRGLSVIAAEQTAGGIISIAGTGLGSAVSLTADAAVAATTLTVSSTSGLAAGDVLLLSDNTIPDSAYPTQLSGELVQVASVSGTTINLAHGDQSGAVRGTFVDLGDTTGYTTAASASIRKVSMASGVTVSDLTLRGNPAGFGSAGGVSVSWARGVSLSRLEISDLGGSGVGVTTSLAVQVSDVWIHDLIDDIANGRYGYGVNIKGASSLITVTGCVIERVRHAFTTNGDNWSGSGIPSDITVSGCRAIGTHNSSFDTHGAGFNVTFAGCTSSDSLYGFSVRARRVTITGCEVVRPDLDGLTFWGFARYTLVSGLIVRDSQRYGANIENGSDLDLVDVTVKRSASHGIRLVPTTGHGNRVKVSRPRIYDVGTGGSGSIGVFINASGRAGIEVLNGIFVRTDGALAYRSAVDISAASSAIIAGNRGVNLGFASAGMIVDAGTSTVLFDNMILDGSTQDARASLPTATTTNLTSATHRLNLAKRAGMCVFNTTTNRPVYATGTTATSVWVDSTGATAHTPV